MNGLFFTLVGLCLAVFWAYRQICVLRFYLARRRAQRGRFRGLRLVISNRSCRG
jgi:hypothetical protein